MSHAPPRAGNWLSLREQRALRLVDLRGLHPAEVDAVRARVYSMPPGPAREEWVIALAVDLFTDGSNASGDARPCRRLGSMTRRVQSGKQILMARGMALDDVLTIEEVMEALKRFSRENARWHHR